MFDTPVSDLAARDTLTRASRLRRLRNLVDADELAIAAHWADLNAVLAHTTALPGGEQLVRFGGDGTPAVAEFAPAELGATLGVSYAAACGLIGDALDLRHRHPLVWDRVQAGDVKGWAARTIAQTTRPLSVDACGLVDRTIAPYADRKTPGELVAIAEAEAIRADPDLAQQRADAAQRGRGVFVSPNVEAGVQDLFVRANAADITRFDEALDRVARDLKALGDESSNDVRRAKAVGVLASPQLALDLHAQATGDQPVVNHASGFPATTVYVHLTDQTLTSGDGVARVEGIGPVLASQVAHWLRHDKVTVKPVIDLNHQAPVDGYEIPDQHREAVHLTTPCDTFPYATNKSRHKDIDHTVPRLRLPKARGRGKPRPPPHREQPADSSVAAQQHPNTGIIIWQSPHGTHYLIDHTGTRPIDLAG